MSSRPVPRLDASVSRGERLPEVRRPPTGVVLDEDDLSDVPPDGSGESDRVGEILALFGQFGIGGPAPSPVGDKLTPEHISTILDINRQRIGLDRASEKEGRWLHLAALFLFCAFVLLLVTILLSSGNDQLTEKVLLGLVSLVAGAMGGYGIGRSQG